MNLCVSNSKLNLIFFEVELVTRKKNYDKNFRVSNSKWTHFAKLGFVTLFRNSRIPNLKTRLFLNCFYFAEKQILLEFKSTYNLFNTETPIFNIIAMLVILRSIFSFTSNDSVIFSNIHEKVFKGLSNFTN